ncbi:MAG: PadR family transcriptional regulator [Actinobacteria bacterium]|nr:MAG: PadR family transcriptional regulator [Actinomycetota bacterium]
MTEVGESIVRKFQKELNSGTVSLVLLAILDQSSEALYGYQIAKRLEGASADSVPVKQGTLYPVLRQLEAHGLLGSTVEPSVAGPPRRYYTITPAGREVLEQWKQTWSRTRDFVDGTLEGGRG